MQKFLLASTLLMGGAFLVGDLGAHGGTYRGPGDTVPPGAGGDPGEGAPTGPVTPGGPGTPPGTGGNPLGPATGPNTPPQGGGPRSTPGSGFNVAADLSQWSFWWEFNKDGFLNLRQALDQEVITGDGSYWLGDGAKAQGRTTVRPSRAQIEEDIVPALLAALESETNKDIVTGCLIALAKIGDRVDESGHSQFQETLADFLTHANQEIRETAAIALGILANPGSLDLLEALVFNRELGQRAVGSNEVDLRTRSYAAYGLGLVGARNDSPEVRERIVASLLEALPMTHGMSSPDVGVAVVSSLGLVPLQATPAPLEPDAAVITIPQQIEALLEFFGNVRHDRFVRAHVPTAVARLYAAYEGSASPADAAQIKAQLAPALLLPLDRKQGRELESEVRMASALALGLVGDADTEGLDAEIREALIGAAEDPLRQVRKFALIGLAKSAARAGQDPDQTKRGRDETVDYLVRNMERGRSGVERWAGVAAGVYAFQMSASGEAAPASLFSSLSKQLDQAKAVDDIGAFAVAAGLFGNKQSVEELLERLDKTAQDEARGYVALALGMLGDRRAIDPIQEVVRESEYRPSLLKQAAVALGLLGDREASLALVEMLGEAKGLATQAALASALGQIGDRDSIDLLVEMLGDSTLTDTARGFAAVSLGLVAEKEMLPWNEKLSRDVNYRAATPTLNSTAGTGVLNLL